MEGTENAPLNPRWREQGTADASPITFRHWGSARAASLAQALDIPSRSPIFIRNLVLNFFGISAAIFVVYSVVLFNVYDYHDSFEYFLFSTGSCKTFSLLPYLALTGRPLSAFFYCHTVPHLMSGIETAGWARAEGLLVISVAATMLNYYLRRCRLTRNAAAFGAIFCFLLPGPTQFVYASHATSNTWPFLFTIGAAFCLLWLVDAIGRGRSILASVLVPTAIGLLTISTLTHQSVSETFLALVFIRMLTTYEEGAASAVGYLLWAGLIFVLHLAVYLAAHYTVDIPLLLAHGWPIQDILGNARSISISPGTWWETVSLIEQRTLRALTLWFYGCGPAVAAALASLIAMLYALVARQGLKTESASLASRMHASVALLMLFAMFAVLTNGLALVKPDPLMLLFRTMIAYQWVFVFLILYFASELETALAKVTVARIPRGVYGALGVGIAAFVAWNLYYNFVRPNVAEFAYLKHVVAADRDRLSGTTCVVQPNAEALGSVARYPVIDEFGRTTMMYPQRPPMMIGVIARSLGIPSDKIGRIVVFKEKDRPPNLTCDETIDMRWLDHFDRGGS